MEPDWYCTEMLKARHQCWRGLLWIHKRLLVSPQGRQGSPRPYVQFLAFNIEVNRVVIAGYVIATIFNPGKCWTVTIQLLLSDTLLISTCIGYWQFLLFDLCFLQCFVRFNVYLMQCFCLTQFFCSMFKLFSIFSVLILEMYTRYFDHVIHQPSSSQ